MQSQSYMVTTRDVEGEGVAALVSDEGTKRVDAGAIEE